MCVAAFKLSAPHPSLCRDAAFKLSFDFDEQLERTDWDDPQRGAAHSLVLTPEQRILFRAGSHVVERFPPDKEIAGGDVYPIDLRLVGLIGLSEMQFAADWEQMRERLRGMGRPEVYEEDDGMFRIVWLAVKREEGSKGPYDQTERRTTWIDSKRAFVPTRTEDAFDFTPPGEKGEQETWAVTETDWSERDGVFVPTKCAFALPKNSKTAEMTFTWEQVNRPVDTNLFTVDGLPLEPPTTVVDTRLGPSLVERIVGQPPPQVPIATSSRWRTVAAVVSLALLAGASLLFLFHSMRKTRA